MAILLLQGAYVKEKVRLWEKCLCVIQIVLQFVLLFAISIMTQNGLERHIVCVILATLCVVNRIGRTAARQW